MVYSTKKNLSYSGSIPGVQRAIALGKSAPMKAEAQSGVPATPFLKQGLEKAYIQGDVEKYFFISTTIRILVK